MKNRNFLIGAVIVAIASLAYLLSRGPSNDSPNKIIIAEGSQPIAAPVYVAYENGYFKDEGLTVELVPFATGKFCLDALIGGKADFATVAETPIMHATFTNQPIKIVATIHRSQQNTFCVANRKKGINTPADLKGKTVAVPIGTNAEYAFSAFLSSVGLKPTDLKIINLTPPEMSGPLSKGDVDAVVAWQPHIGRCEKALRSDAVLFSFKPVYQETYNLVTSSLMAEEKNEITVKVLKALDRAIEFMRANPEQSIGIVARRLNMDTTELTKIWPIYNFGLDLKPSLIATLTKEGAWSIKQGQHDANVLPDMRNVISITGLKAVKKDSVLIK